MRDDERTDFETVLRLAFRMLRQLDVMSPKDAGCDALVEIAERYGDPGGHAAEWRTECAEAARWSAEFHAAADEYDRTHLSLTTIPGVQIGRLDPEPMIVDGVTVPPALAAAVGAVLSYGRRLDTPETRAGLAAALRAARLVAHEIGWRILMSDDTLELTPPKEDPHA